MVGKERNVALVAETAKNNFNKIRVTETERAETLLAVRGASNARFLEVVAAVRMIVWGREAKKDKAADMLLRVRRHNEQAKSKLAHLGDVKVSELREKID